MILFGTRCPHCNKAHIAMQSQLGLMVICSSCMREFVCIDETGELPFVKTRDLHDVPISFEKSISRAFFVYGIAVPSSFHDIVKSRLSKMLSIGSVMDVRLVFNGMDFPAELKYFVNHRGATCLHLKWVSGSGIHKRLAESYKDEHEYYIVENGDSAKSWKVKVSVSPQDNVFLLDEERFPSRGKGRGQGRSGLSTKRRSIPPQDEMSLDELLREE